MGWVLEVLETEVLEAEDCVGAAGGRAKAEKKTEPLTGCGHEASHARYAKMLWWP